MPIEDDAYLARAFVELSRLTHDHAVSERYRRRARSALESCDQPGELRRMGRMVGPLLVALEAFAADSISCSVVGEPDDATTDALVSAAQRLTSPFRLVERTTPDTSRYPYPGAAAVYLCSRSACSLPVTDPARLPEAVSAFQ